MHLDDLTPTDPFANRAPQGWWAQQELQAFAKGDPKPDGDDPEDDPEDDDDPDDDPDDDLAELSEDELRDELKKTRERLNRTASSNAGKRKRLKQLEQDLIDARKAKASPKPDDKSGDEKVDAAAIKAAADAEAKATADDRIKKAEARGALKAAGVPKEQVSDLVAMLKLDDLDVDDDGEVDGLDDAIDELKVKWPQLFPKGTRKRSSVSGDGDRDGRGDGSKKVLSASERQARVLTGRPSR